MKKYILYLLLSSFLLPTACESYLDKVPDNRTEIDSPEKISSLLVTAYPDHFWATLCNSRCDYISDFGSVYGGTQPSSYFDFISAGFYWRDEYISGNDTPDRLWSSCYNAIAAANQALQAIATYPDQHQLTLQKGEALLCRAYAHFILVSLFARSYDESTAANEPGIPYVEKVEEHTTEIYDRGTVASVYAKIERDLEEGLKTVGTSADYISPKFHFTKTSAHAFATRFYLMKKDYAQVIAHANAVFPLPQDFHNVTYSFSSYKNQMAPIPDEEDIACQFATNNFQNWISYRTLPSSSAIEQAFSKPTNPSNLLMAEMMTTIGRAYNYSQTRYGATKTDLKNLLKNVCGNTAYSTYTSYGTMLFIPKYYEDFRTVSINANEGIPYYMCPLFRIEEVLLNRAEAYAMTDLTEEAIADLNIFGRQRMVNSNSKLYYDEKKHIISPLKLETYYDEQIRDKEHFLKKYNPETANWPKIKKALLLCLLDFRHMEFLAEGLRWYDILRWRIPVTHTMYNGITNTLYPGDDRQMFQIPETATLSGIKQNKRDHLLSPEW